MLKILILLTVYVVTIPVYAFDLRSILDSAEKIDPALAQAIAIRDAGVEYEAIARARLLPQISATGTYQKYDQSRLQSTSVGPITQNFTGQSTNSQLILRQALIRKRDWLGFSIGKLQVEHSNYELANAYTALWQKVISAWLDTVAAKQLLENYVQSESTVKSASDQATKSYAKGLITKQAMLEVNAQYAIIQANKKEAEFNFNSRKRLLSNLTGLSESELQVGKLPKLHLMQFPFNSTSELVGKALEYSPEIITLSIASQIRSLQLKQADADHIPTIDLVGNIGKSKNDNINQIGSSVNSSAIGLQINIPIYSGGSISAFQRQAAATARAADAELSSLKFKLTNQIELDWATYHSFSKKSEAVAFSVMAAEEEIQASKAGLKAGLKSWSDIGSAQILWSRRHAEYIDGAILGLKTQLRLLAPLPISDESWTVWLNQLSN